MMYLITFAAAAAFSGWLIYKGYHWWDEDVARVGK